MQDAAYCFHLIRHRQSRSNSPGYVSPQVLEAQGVLGSPRQTAMVSPRGPWQRQIQPIFVHAFLNPTYNPTGRWSHSWTWGNP